MSIFDKVVDAIVEKDDPHASPDSVPSHFPSHPILATPNPSPGMIGSASPNLDTASLRMKVEGSSNAGTAFTAALQSLAEYIPDEGSRFKAARKMLSNQGIDIVRVGMDLGSALERLETECKNFDIAKATKSNSDISVRQARMSEIDSQLDQLRAERNILLEAVDAAQRAIDQREQSFMAAAKTLRQEYEGTVNKIKTYLGGN